MAYYINSYNALAMYAALDAGTPQHLNLLDRFRFFVLRKVQYGGEKISLYDYENEVIRAERDARIHFALNCMVVSCPRLPREAFVAARLEAQLDAAAREFLQSAKHAQLDQDQSMVRFSAILDFYTEDFLAEADSLIAYANRFRDEPIPESFAIGFLDYDWTLNRQP